MMKYLAAGVLSLGLMVGGAYGQGADRPGGTTNGTGTTANRTDYNNDRGFNWGWLGLIGLVGLAGLMPRNDDRNRYTTTTGTATRP